MATVTFWNNSDFKGMSDTFNGAQRKNYSTSQAWDSLTTGASTWLVVWDGHDYDGNYMKIDPNTGWYNDLKKAGRGSDGNWKNQIKAIMIYGNQPSWWGSSSTPPNNDLNLQPHDCVFCTGSEFNDDTAVYPANASDSDLGDNYFVTNPSVKLAGTIGSLATGSAAWLQIWNGTNYTGSTLRVYPSTKHPDLNKMPRLPDGDWKNQIQSFQLWNAIPDATWNLGFDENKFFGAFPDAVRLKDSSGPYYHYLTQDCGYDIRLNGVTYPDAYTMNLAFRVDYDLTGKNDKVTLDLLINLDGSFNSVTYEYTQGDAVQIPSSVIKAVDVSAEVLGAVGALETAGISEEAANSFIEAFDTFCKVFNKISNVLFKLSESNDGRFYMVPVCSHVLARALSAVTVAN